MANPVSGLWAKLTGAKPKTSDQRIVDAKAFVEPASRNLQDWSPALIKSAEASANAGSMRAAADLIEGLILADDRAAPTLGIRIRGVLGTKVEFEAGVGRQKKRAVKALEAEEDFYAAYPDDELGQLLTWGLVLGISPGKNAWDYRGQRVIPFLNFWNPRGLRYDWSTRQWMMRVEVLGQASGWQEIPIIAGDGDWILDRPYGKNRPWISGLWRQLARWCLLKHYAVRDIALHGEVHGDPIKLVQPNGADVKGVDPGLRKQLSNDLRDLGRNSVLVLPAGFDFKLVEATAKTWDIYQAQVDMANMAIAVAILGQNMTTEPSKGQHGVTGAIEVRQDLKNSDAASVSATLHDQSLVWWALYNFGDSALAAWPVWPVEAEEDQAKSAATLNVLGEAIGRLNDVGIPVDLVTVCERFKIPITADLLGTPSAQKLFEYHLKYGIVTINEARQKLGLEPMKNGDKAPAQPAPPGSGGAGATAPAGSASAAIDALEAVVHDAIAKQTAEKHDGFHNGQRYADDLVANGRDSGKDSIQPSVDALLAEVDKATSYADLKARLEKLYDGMNADAMTEIVEKTLVLAALAGRTAVLEDL